MKKHPASSIPSAKPNLVLGIAQNYTLAQIEPFLISLRRTGYNDEIVLFHQGMETAALSVLRKAGVTLMPLRNLRGMFRSPTTRRWVDWFSQKYYQHKWPFYKEGWPHLLSAAKQRYLLYHGYLRAMGHRYERVLLTDTRDVFFQADPFASAPGEDLVFFEESHPISHGGLNSVWMICHLGRETLARLSSKMTICSGTVLGKPKAISFYLERFITLMRTADCLSSSTGDQAIHNAVVYEGLEDFPFSIRIAQNGTGPVYTLSRYLQASQIRQSNEGQVLDENGRVVPILHQYDRHPAISQALLKKL